MDDTSTPRTDPHFQQPLGAARQWIVLVLVSLAFFMVELDITVVNVAMPSMRDELGFSAIATSATAMVAGRALQGLGGAMLAPTGLSTLTTTFTGEGERTRALAIWTFIQTGSVALGLALGGIITEVSWRWVFIINIPIAVIVLALAPGALPRTVRAAGGGGFDLAGAVAITAAPALLIYALSNVTSSGWTSVRTVFMLAGALVLFAGFVLVERRVRNPLIRFSIFRIRTLAVGNLSFFLASSALFGMFYFSSLYVQEVLKYRPLPAGLALLPLAAGVLIGVVAAQKLLPRFGLRAVGAGGLTLAVGGASVLATISSSSPYAWPFLPGLVLLSLGLGVAMVALTMLATSGVAEADAGLASGVFTAVSYIGGALGLAVLAGIAAGAGGPLVNGIRTAYLVAAVLLAAAVLVLGYGRVALEQHNADGKSPADPA